MSKCAKINCNEEHSGSKQMNDIVIRAYLCKKHLIESAVFDSFSDGNKFLGWLRE